MSTNPSEPIVKIEPLPWNTMSVEQRRLHLVAQRESKEAEAREARRAELDLTDDSDVSDELAAATFNELWSAPLTESKGDPILTALTRAQASVLAKSRPAAIVLPSPGHTPVLDSPRTATTIQGNPWYPMTGNQSVAATPAPPSVSMFRVPAPHSAPASVLGASPTAQVAPASGTLSAGASPRNTTVIADAYTLELNRMYAYHVAPPIPPAVRSAGFCVAGVQTRAGYEALLAKSQKANIEFMRCSVDLNKAIARSQEAYAAACRDRSNAERYHLGLNDRKEAEEKASEARVAAHKAKRAKLNPLDEQKKKDY